MQMQRTEKQLIKENVYSIFAQAIQQASGVHQNWNRKRDGHLSYMLGLHVLPMISEKIRQDMNLSIIWSL